MKIKEDYILQQIADEWLVIDTNCKSVNFNNVLSLNDSARFLWKMLEKNTDLDSLVSALIAEYDIDRAKAVQDVQGFLDKLKKLKCLQEEN